MEHDYKTISSPVAATFEINQKVRPLDALIITIELSGFNPRRQPMLRNLVVAFAATAAEDCPVKNPKPTFPTAP